MRRQPTSPIDCNLRKKKRFHSCQVCKGERVIALIVRQHFWNPKCSWSLQSLQSYACCEEVFKSGYSNCFIFTLLFFSTNYFVVEKKKFTLFLPVIIDLVPFFLSHMTAYLCYLKTPFLQLNSSSDWIINQGICHPNWQLKWIKNLGKRGQRFNLSWPFEFRCSSPSPGLGKRLTASPATQHRVFPFFFLLQGPFSKEHDGRAENEGAEVSLPTQLDARSGSEQEVVWVSLLGAKRGFCLLWGQTWRPNSLVPASAPNATILTLRSLIPALPWRVMTRRSTRRTQRACVCVCAWERRSSSKIERKFAPTRVCRDHGFSARALRWCCELFKDPKTGREKLATKKWRAKREKGNRSPVNLDSCLVPRQTYLRKIVVTS